MLLILNNDAPINISCQLILKVVNFFHLLEQLAFSILLAFDPLLLQHLAGGEELAEGQVVG